MSFNRSFLRLKLALCLFTSALVTESQARLRDCEKKLGNIADQDFDSAAADLTIRM